MYGFAGPAEVRGKYEKIRNLLQPVLILIFLVTPWLKINQQPVLLLNFFKQHFVLMGHSFFAHDAPLLFFLTILIILVIFSITAVFGRLWCGWSCPQTVFLHAVFNKIEKMIMGTYAKRTSFYKHESGFAKSAKIIFLYSVFLFICWTLSHSFVAYFVGAETVTNYITHGPALHLKAFSVLMIMTGVLFFNFAFFREKLCLYICPYGRFQNALIDTNTLVVFYNALRGEPRHKTKDRTQNSGDCVSCNRCVSVCPVKIDIRRGFQQECIACAKCIDACNEVMHKVKSPPLLIRFDTGDLQKITLKRFRLVLYAGLLIIFSGAFAWSLSSRSEVDFSISRSAMQPFSSRVEQNRKILQNQLHLHLKNQTQGILSMSIELSEKNINQGYRISSAVVNMNLQSEQDVKMPAFIEINESDFKSADRHIEIYLKYGDKRVLRPLNFVGVP